MSIEDEANYVTRLSKKIAHLRKARQQEPWDPHPSHYITPTSILSRRKSKQKRKLTENDIIDISQKVMIEKEYMTNVAKEFRTTPGAISNVIKRVKNDPAIFEKKKQKREEKQEQRNAVIRAVNLMNANYVPLESSH